MLFKILLTLHLIGSSIWVGGHLILFIMFLPKALKQRDPSVVAVFEDRFEPIGIPALALQIATGIWLAYSYTTNLFDVFDFVGPQHSIIAIKLILLLLTVVIALHARLRVISNLTKENLSFLAWHITTVTVLAVTMLFLGAGIRVGGWW